MNWAERIICMTEETVETLYLLEEHERIAGISGFTVRPSQARKVKPKVLFEEWYQSLDLYGHKKESFRLWHAEVISPN